MSNRAYLLNSKILTNDYVRLNELSKKHGVVYDEAAQAANRLPLPWLCCFRQSDLRPYTVCYEDSDGNEVRETCRIPCISLGNAVRNLKASLPLYEKIVGDARIAREYWQDAVTALELLPLPFLTLYAEEVIDGAYAEFAAALSGNEDAIPHLLIFCGYSRGSLPFTLGEWSNLSFEELRDDETRRYNAAALDCAFGFGAPLHGADAANEEIFAPPRKVFLNRGQGVDLADMTSATCLVVTLQLDSLEFRDFDFFCFALDESNKPLPGGYAVFRNQPCSPDGGIEFFGRMDQRQDIRLDLTRLSPKASRLILVLQRKEVKQEGLNYLQLRISDLLEDLVDFALPGDEVPTERTLLLGEIRLDAARRVSVACKAYPQGVENLLKHFGVESGGKHGTD